MITAPYNFVPLNKEVFYPDWDKDISHDIPFQDGESGMIDIEITAKSPIFIRSHYQDGDEFYTSKNGDKISKEFCHIKVDGGKEYYIPGTSIKGMTRSVLEILSFSKMALIQDRILNVRDMTNQKELVGGGKGCGFLVKIGDTYAIEDCGKPRSISFDEVQKATGVSVRKMKTAEEKYKKIGIIDISVKKDKKMMTMYNGEKRPKDIALFDANSSQKAQLVLTGTINNKKNEFVFIRNNKTISLDNHVAKKFKAVYFNEESVDGQFWEKQWEKGQVIPVFYAKNQQGEISDIGLTQLFKLAYSKTLAQAAQQNTQKDKLDLTECIFGMVEDDTALKGRVQFSHMKSSHETFEAEKSEILGEPNPTYYPNYIRQQNVKGDKVTKYSTLMDKDAEISGWKRYPLHQSIVETKGGNDNEDVRSKFKPLSTDTVFKGKIRFHNLKKAEIGALLSALTFHGREASNYHNLGMAKSLGYGKVSIDLILSPLLMHNDKEYLEAFETEITKTIHNWQNSSQLKELFAMSHKVCKDNVSLAYQLLENPKPKYDLHKRRAEANDFTGAKKGKEYLLPHSMSIKSNNEKRNQPKINKPTTQRQSKPLHLPNAEAFTMDQIAKEVSVSVQEVIDFSVGLNFGTLHSKSVLKEAQAKDLMNKMKSPKKAPTVPKQVPTQPDGISKTKLRKVISAYWLREFGVSYHRNQVKEFISGQGFDTTPEEQRILYVEKEGDTEFKKLCQLVFMIEFGTLDEEKKESFYLMLTQ